MKMSGLRLGNSWAINSSIMEEFKFLNFIPAGSAILLDI